MNLVADESADLKIVARLRLDGHLVSYIAEMAPGVSDEAVLEWAKHEGAVLLTADKDFGELVFRHGRVTWGVVLIQLSGLSAASKAEAVAAAVVEHGPELWESFSVIGVGTMRIRRPRS